MCWHSSSSAAGETDTQSVGLVDMHRGVYIYRHTVVGGWGALFRCRRADVIAVFDFSVENNDQKQTILQKSELGGICNTKSSDLQK